MPSPAPAPGLLLLLILRGSADAACTPLNEYTCTNGLCISSFDACDGKIDCSDGSDETPQLCSKISRCSSGGFRCSYGACVDLSSKCNGVRDCADNSDELLPECLNSSSIGLPPTGRPCRATYAPCDSGQCVNEFSFCDGVADCDDGSDETAKRCINFVCPPMAFRCGYGACIEKRLTCNGLNDCQDGSDESGKVCGAAVASSSSSPLPTAPTPTPHSSCAYPDQPQNGNYQIHSQGLGVVTLNYTCNSGYALKVPYENDPYLISLCANGIWTEPNVTCQKLCLPFSSKSLEVSCSYRKREVDCCVPSLPGTIAKLSCEVGHRHQEPKPEFNSVRCLPTGLWDKKPFKCNQVCGQRGGAVRPLIAHGVPAKVGEFPWHVGLFWEKVAETFEYACGGTIINKLFVVSAAHCVHHMDKLVSPNIVHVVAGKYTSEWDTLETTEFRTKAKSLFVPRDYGGAKSYFQNDLVLIQVEMGFSFGPFISPICVDWIDSHSLLPGYQGTIVGWGMDEQGNKVTKELRSTKMSFLRNKDCQDRALAENQLYIRGDKFCAEYINKSGVAAGDSGGGYIIEVRGEWTLYGVVSLRLSETPFAVFTNLTPSLSWISKTSKVPDSCSLH